MLFNSLEFGVFLIGVLSVYLLLSRRAQNRWLLAASYLFYGAWDWRFLALILLSTVVDYWVGRRLGGSAGPRRRRLLLIVSLATNLGILSVFKYAGFFAESMADLARLVGISMSPLTLQLTLPVGISFYTFQTLSYSIDVYRRRLEPTTDFLDFALFVAFFPQLVAGPIERANRLLPQITAKRQVEWSDLGSGGWLLLWGLYKKVVIGDNVGLLADAVFAVGAAPTAPEIVAGTVAFAVQIYCDFSGYSDMARGIARLLGFELMVNFRLPYFARNPSDFWRRWHISLSTWLRDYLYVPLGGSRGGLRKTYRNLGLTMLLGGLWHGAAWNFVVWGGYHGILLAGHRVYRDRLAKQGPPELFFIPARPWLRQAIAIVVMFGFTCVGWVLFRVETMGQAAELTGRLVRGPWTMGLVRHWLLPLGVLCGPLLAMQIGQAIRGDLEFILSLPVGIRTVVYAVLGIGIIVLGQDFGQPFIYFQF